jgi:hypothetical protein
MNVLILTPDRVGSTLLQRLITVYMQANDFDRPVINLHELTNGLVKYYSPVFNDEVLGKPQDRPWGYFQSLEEITQLLNSVSHYKTSRLAHYHIKNRLDDMSQQVPFYQYLNDNFCVISARRENLLEHALSWCIFTHSKRLNVFGHEEKIRTFADIYKNKIHVDPESMIKYLNQYLEYTEWVDNHFTVSSYFYYERDLPRIEDYILNLSIFNNTAHKTWQDTFDITFQDWNMCHYLISDMSGIGLQLENSNKNPALTFNPSCNNYQLQALDQSAIGSGLSTVDQTFLNDHIDLYRKTSSTIAELVEQKVLVTGVPIKLQTMMEKKLLIKNFNQCVDVYNQWVTVTGCGKLYTDEQLMSLTHNEVQSWHANQEYQTTAALKIQQS